MSGLINVTFPSLFRIAYKRKSRRRVGRILAWNSLSNSRLSILEKSGCRLLLRWGGQITLNSVLIFLPLKCGVVIFFILVCKHLLDNHWYYLFLSNVVFQVPICIWQNFDNTFSHSDRPKMVSMKFTYLISSMSLKIKFFKTWQ